MTEDPDWFLAIEDVRAALERAWYEGWHTSDGWLSNPYRLRQAPTVETVPICRTSGTDHANESKENR